MPVCTLCQSLDLLNPPQLSQWNRYPVTSKAYTSLVSILSSALIDTYREKKETTGRNVEPLGLPYYQSLDELHTAAKADCAICKVVERDVEKFRGEFEAQKTDNKAVSRPELGGPDWKMWITRGKNDTGGFMIVTADAERDYRIWVVSAVGICVDYDDPLGELVRGRKAQDAQEPEKALKHAVDWVHECDKQRTNTRCHVDEAALPVRVLDVQSHKPGGVALYEPKGETGRYAALSHVWGDMTPFTTTKADLEEYKKGIEMEKLPKTFSDTILVARTMGIRYLWIDALCICQDDEDWSRDSPKISTVYSNAYILLSATGSSSDTDGLSLFSPSRLVPDYGTFEYTTDEIIGTVYAFCSSAEVAAHPFHDTLLAHEPLSQDAWALQEQWLAPRILYFGSNQLFYECYCHFLSEDGFSSPGRSDTFFASTAREAASPPEVTWEAVISAYCRRCLPRPEDKLPALSGLARKYAERTGDTYVAGFWTKSLVESMIWQAVGTTTPSPIYRAPSWSWAAIDGPFGMFTPGFGPDAKEPWSRVAIVVSCHIELKDSGKPYGEINAASLTLRAPLEPLSPAEGEEVDGFPNRQKGPRMQTKNGKGKVATVFDTPVHAERARGRSLFAMVLMRNMSSGCSGKDVCSPVYHCIVVARVEGKEEGTYERLGKIPIGHEEMGECAWMGDEGGMESVILV